MCYIGQSFAVSSARFPLVRLNIHFLFPRHGRHLSPEAVEHEHLPSQRIQDPQVDRACALEPCANKFPMLPAGLEVFMQNTNQMQNLLTEKRGASPKCAQPPVTTSNPLFE